MKVKCCGETREGNFCANCGRRLVSGRIKKLQDRVRKLEGGIRRYLEAYYKKRAGSTIQYSVAWLEELLDDE